jgi:hypothetical protein
MSRQTSKGKTIPTWQDVAQSFKSLAQLNLTQGPTKAYDTGNLYREIGSFNDVRKMITKKPTGSKNKIELDEWTMSLTFAPPGAKYGKFVEMGTRYMKARPFTQEAANSPMLTQQIKDLQSGIADDISIQIMNQLQSAFAGLNKSI